jgi:DNA replication protein DnaC
MLKAYRDDMIAQIENFDWNFNDHDDDNLKAMHRAAKIFLFDFLMSAIDPDKHTPYWLTLLGPSETGKTHLAHAIYRFFKEHIETTFVPVNGYEKLQILKHTGEFIMASETGKQAITMHGLLRRLNEANLIIIDELDPHVSRIEKDQVCKLMSWRAGAGNNPFRWMVVTSNLTRQQVADEFDPRIASRLRRESNVVIELPIEIEAFLDRPQSQ